MGNSSNSIVLNLDPCFWIPTPFLALSQVLPAKHPSQHLSRHLLRSELILVTVGSVLSSVSQTSQTSQTSEISCPDADLIDAVRQGDSRAFSQLVSRHYNRALQTALGMVKNRHDAEDVAQEAFVRVHKQLDKFEGNAKFTTWLYRIVVNLSIDHLRKHKRRRLADVSEEQGREAMRSDDELWPSFDHSDPELSLQRKEMTLSLQKAFAALSDIHRAVILLREIEGLSYDEIATTLSLKKGTVMSRLFHARKQIQEFYREGQGSQIERSDQELSAKSVQEESVA